MNCPQCKLELRETQVDEIVLDRCTGCGGLWFDFAGLERVVSKDSFAFRKFLPAAGGRGQTRAGQFTIFRRNRPRPPAAAEQTTEAHNRLPGPQKIYIAFDGLADGNGISALLVHRRPGRSDGRWVSSPASDGIEQLSSKDNRTSFAGSHFFHEDISGRNVTSDTHELIETTEQYFVLKSTPKEPNAVEFSHCLTWIHRRSFLPIQTIYYDGRAKALRQYKTLETKTIGGYLTVTRSQMSDLRSGTSTLLQYTDIKYDIPLPEKLFTKQHLIGPQWEHLNPKSPPMPK